MRRPVVRTSSPRKPVIHGRDHEHGGADVMRIHWDDGTGGGDGGGGGGGDWFHTITVSMTFPYEDIGTSTTYASTFSNGAAPGWWAAGSGAAWMTSVAVSGTGWTVAISGTVHYTGTASPLHVVLSLKPETGFTSTTPVVIFDQMMATGATLPLSYTGTWTQSSGSGSLSLPIPGGGFGAPNLTIDATVTFTEV